MISHPNKIPFIGILTYVDVPSDKSPSGARGHLVILSRIAAVDALDSLIGMGINVAAEESPVRHNPSYKVGIITKAELLADEIFVEGFVYGLDFPQVVKRLRGGDYGMSYELHDAHIEDLRQEEWKILKTTFIGACVLPRDKAAYKLTEFVLL